MIGLALAGVVGGAVAEAATGTLPPVIHQAHAPAAGRSAPQPPDTLQDAFTAAAAEFHVPVPVLMAVSYQETLWESHQGEPSATGNYNVMGLTSVSVGDLVPAGAAGKQADLAAAGDTAAPAAPLLSRFETVDTSAPALHTLDAAAALIKQPDAALRGGMQQSVRGGAALLASYEQDLDGGLPTSAARWYGAVAQYSQGTDALAQTQFADRVYATIASGAARTTDDGQAVALAAEPSVKPVVPAALRPGAAAGRTVARGLAAAPVPARPCDAGTATGLGSCALVAAAVGNGVPADRPADGSVIRYVVLGSTDGSAASAVSTAATRGVGATAHYVVSATGAVTQQLSTHNIGVLAGNDSVDAHAVDIETENYLLRSGSWISEQEYASSADLVRNLARRYGIPLDRDHVLGQDDVPYATVGQVSDRRSDPGPYWDWGHFLALLGVAPDGDGMPVVGGTVTIAPAYSAADKPVLTGCSGDACVGHPADFVYLRTSPSSSAPLLGDAMLASSGLPTGGTGVTDDSDKAVYGQTFVVAALSADSTWTAVWFGGRKAWFYNPGGVNSYANADPAQDLVSSKNGTAIPVYGRAFPETSAYAAAGAPAAVQQLTPLSYTIQPGQAYTASGELTGDHYTYGGPVCVAKSCKDVIGTTAYYAIRYNHRIGYVLAADVQVTHPVVPPSGSYARVPTTRIMDTTDGTGGVPVAPVRSGGTVGLQLTGAGLPGLPASGVTAAELEVTVLSPRTSGSVTVHPDGLKRPALPTLDYTAGVTSPTPVTVPVVDGRLDFGNSPVPGATGGSVDLAVDLTGYFTMSGGGGPFHTTGPVRVLDTAVIGPGVVATDSRGGRLGAGGSVTLQVAGLDGVPRNATAVILNLTAAKASTFGAVTVHPYGTAVPALPPAADTLSFAKGELVARQITVPLVDGRVQFHSSARGGPGGGVELLADLVGYYTH